MFSSCNPKFFAVRHIHYPVNPSSDHFHTDVVVPSSDHRRTETVAPSGHHYCIDIVVPSSEHCCTEIIPPSSDHNGTTKVATPSDHFTLKERNYVNRTKSTKSLGGGMPPVSPSGSGQKKIRGNRREGGINLSCLVIMPKFPVMLEPVSQALQVVQLDNVVL